MLENDAHGERTGKSTGRNRHNWKVKVKLENWYYDLREASFLSAGAYSHMAHAM